MNDSIITSRAGSDLLTIGAVLNVLKQEFPDVDITISKIRFLEAEGLVVPARTPSGYRKFSPADVNRLRYTLRMQRDHFLPLRVIRDQLDKADDTELVINLTDSRSQPIGSDGASAPTPEQVASPSSESAKPAGGAAPLVDDRVLSLNELAGATGMSVKEILDLEKTGIISRFRGTDEFRPGTMQILGVIRTLRSHGLDSRHLRQYVTGADRDVDLIARLMESRRRSARTPDDLARLRRDAFAAAKAGMRLQYLLIQKGIAQRFES